MALAWACGLAPLVGLGLAGAAQAATVGVADFGDGVARMTVTMDTAVSVTRLTLSRDSSGARRIHEDGVVVTPSFVEPNVGGCTQDVSDIVCSAAVPFVWAVRNNSGSTTTPTRDIVIATSATHGDPGPLFFDDPLDVRTTTLMEAWLPDGVNVPIFLGSAVVTGTAAVPADIVHAGSAGLSSPTAMGGLGAGADLVIGSTGAMNVFGGGGDDTLIGSSAADTLDGGADSDTIRGGLGQDTLTAGTGFVDILSYDDAARTSPLSMTFTPNAATTPNPDGDAVSTGFDGIEGTPLGDALTAGATGAVLRGAEGDDLLQGGPAVDRFDGGDGADIIHADDGNAETVDCGAGIDQFFTFDAGDTLIGCEGPQPIDPGPAPGGGAAPAQAGVLPVALTGAATTGAGPGGSSLRAIGATLTAAFGVRGSATTVTTLTAKKLPAGASVTITCAGPKGKKSGCAFKTKKKSFPKATASSAFGSLFKKRRLPVKSVIVVRISGPGVRAKQFTFTTRKSKQPKRVAGCLAPGSATATSC